MSGEAPPESSAREQRLHPWSWLFVLLQQLRQFILPLLALLFFGAGKREDNLWMDLAPAIGIAVLVVLSVLQYFTYRYRVGRDGLSVREGWLHRSRREIPFSRIHNVVVHQSLLHRLFGVAEVRLESAGGQKPEAQMRVLGLQDALALENLVRHQGTPASTSAQADAAAPPAHAQDTTLLALSTPEVVRLGLVSNRGMIVVAAAFGGAWQILPDRMMERLFRQAAERAHGYAEHLHMGWMAGALAALALLVLAMALVRALSVALALLQFHGFRLSEDTRRLMVERGLFARLRTSVARRRIQAWTLEEGVLHRLLGRRTLRIDTAVAESGRQQDMRAFKDVAPIATPDACDALVRHLLPHADWPREDWRGVGASARWRLLLPTLALLVPATAAAAWLSGTWAWLAAPWLVAAAHAARHQAGRMGYAVDARLVAARGGWWSRYWRFAEIDKLQALRLARSPLDRRCGTATLWLDTAGATGLAPPLRLRFLPEAEARALFAQLSAALARQPLRW